MRHITNPNHVRFFLVWSPGCFCFTYVELKIPNQRGISVLQYLHFHPITRIPTRTPLPMQLPLLLMLCYVVLNIHYWLLHTATRFSTVSLNSPRSRNFRFSISLLAIVHPLVSIIWSINVIIDVVFLSIHLCFNLNMVFLILSFHMSYYISTCRFWVVSSLTLLQFSFYLLPFWLYSNISPSNLADIIGYGKISICWMQWKMSKY